MGSTLIQCGLFFPSCRDASNRGQSWCVYTPDQFEDEIDAFSGSDIDGSNQPDYRAAWKAFKDTAVIAGRCLQRLPVQLVPEYPLLDDSNWSIETNGAWFWLNQLIRFSWQHQDSALDAQGSFHLGNEQ